MSRPMRYAIPAMTSAIRSKKYIADKCSDKRRTARRQHGFIKRIRDRGDKLAYPHKRKGGYEGSDKSQDYDQYDYGPTPYW